MFVVAAPVQNSVADIDAYVASVKAKNDKKKFRVFAFIPHGQSGGTWKEFATEVARDKAQEKFQNKTGQVFSQNAFVYGPKSSISQVNFTYYSESGDWYDSKVLFYRPDHTVAKMEEHLSFIPENYEVQKNIYFSPTGEKLKTEETITDSNTHQPKTVETPFDSGFPAYRKISLLPFKKLLAKGH